MISSVISLCLLSFFFIGLVHAWPNIPFLHTVVQIHNAITNSDLAVHCYAPYYDLGPQDLPPGTQYEFQFKPSFFFNTKFNCSFGWTNITQSNDMDVSRTFDIYAQSRDFFRCPDLCTWWITIDGPCRGVGSFNCVPFPWQ
ncbi:hypothetical protein MLD38_019201 [Melastoma candidum]|uniref:Uncharacterized protein n=1 Tax=Melastoma candidum TaxID=119954 RepID=A0ACB9QW84_9MYRT|nr:hypothetical protein MLD38_019201 [Melastoma candidum]